MKRILTSLFVCLACTFAANAGVLNFTATPASGSCVESLSKISLTFETDMLDALYEYGDQGQYGSDAKQIAVKNQDGDSIACCTWAWTSSWFVIDLNLNTKITEPGTYSITLPEGLVQELDTDWNVLNATEETTLVYTIGNPTDIKVFGGRNQNATDEMFFNLNGQRVNAATNGILIKNGKKYINR